MPWLKINFFTCVFLFSCEEERESVRWSKKKTILLTWTIDCDVDFWLTEQLWWLSSLDFLEMSDLSKLFQVKKKFLARNFHFPMLPVWSNAVINKDLQYFSLNLWKKKQLLVHLYYTHCFYNPTLSLFA